MPDLLVLFALLSALGICAGFMAGMLGIGGGIILVPGIYYILSFLGFAQENGMHVAVATSLAVIVPTGLSSARAHWKKKAVEFALVRKIGAGIIGGAIAGSAIADFMDGNTLKGFFASLLMALALVMFFELGKKNMSSKKLGNLHHIIAGFIIGTISTLIGIGGATMSIPYMNLSGVPIRKSVGTASALGVVIAIPASIGLIISGLNEDNLPPFNLGYVNLLAFGSIAVFSVLMAPVGAKIAHVIPVKFLRRIFAVFMVIVSIRMFLELSGR